MKNSTIVSERIGEQTEENANAVYTYKALLAEFEKQQTGYAPIAIIAQSCLGSAAAMVVLMSSGDMAWRMVLVFFITILCMFFNASILAQLKAKLVFNLLIASVVFSALVIIAHIM